MTISRWRYLLQRGRESAGCAGWLVECAGLLVVFALCAIFEPATACGWLIWYLLVAVGVLVAIGGAFAASSTPSEEEGL